MRPVCSIDELRADTNTVATPTDTPLEHISDAEFAPYLAHIDGFALVLEA